jgi:type II secretory pathway component GspD/PulD (secretin)
MLENAEIKVEPVRNQLVVSLSPKHYQEFLELIPKLDVAPMMIQLDLVIAEVDVHNGKELMADFALRIGATSGIEDRAFGLTAKKRNEIIDSLLKKGLIRKQFNPKIVTLLGKTARILDPGSSANVSVLPCLSNGFLHLEVTNEVRESEAGFSSDGGLVIATETFRLSLKVSND